MFEAIRQALRSNFHLGWNLFLALVPLVLALWLFRKREKRGLLWWPGLFAFVAFLPNAAYTLTDVIHFIDEVRSDEPQLLPEWSVTYILMPKYAAFMFLGFQSHVISLILMGSYLRWMGRKSWIFVCEWSLNLLCAIGVYWGRYVRLNSWEFVTRPQKLAKSAIESIIGDNMAPENIVRYFIVITVFYYIVKFIDLAVWEHWQRRRLEGLFPARIAAWMPRRKPRAPQPEAAQSN